MTERIIDSERAGGTDTTPRSLAAPEMTYSEALEYHQKFAWRTVPSRSDRARQALVAEVERLQSEMADDRELARRQTTAWASGHRDLANELARFRDALPGIIGCADGDPATCTHDPPGYWAPCCRVRRRCVAAGLLSAVEKVADVEDGL